MLRKFENRPDQDVSGFKSPADDYTQNRLNITESIVIDPHATFYFQMDSKAMRASGLEIGDILIIDKSLKAVPGAIVVAYVDDAFYCRLYALENGRAVLKSDTEVINFTSDNILQVWGVVTSIFRNTLPKELRKGKYRRVCAL